MSKTLIIAEKPDMAKSIATALNIPKAKGCYENDQFIVSNCIGHLIELDVPEEELMKRLLLRGQLSGRSDDNEETIKKRLDVYHNQTSPLIDWYEKEGIRHHIKGYGELATIFADVCKVIDALD